MVWKIRSLWAAAAVILASGALSSVARAQAPAPAVHKTVGVALQGDQDGIQVTSLLPGAPAEKAGIRVGDQVISVAGISIFEFDKAKFQPLADTAKSIIFVVMRDGQKKTFEVVPAVVSAATPPQGRDTATRSPSQ